MLVRLLLTSFCSLAIAPRIDYASSKTKLSIGEASGSSSDTPASGTGYLWTNHASPSQISQDQDEAQLRVLQLPHHGSRLPKPQSREKNLKKAIRNPDARQPERFFTTEERLRVQQDWNNNEDELRLLHQNSKELSLLKSHVQNELESITSGLEEDISGSIRIFANDLTRKISEEFHPTLDFFIDQKILQTGEIDLLKSKANFPAFLAPEAKQPSTGKPVELPEDITDNIFRRSLKAYAGLAVNKLKQLMSSGLEYEALCLKNKKFVHVWWEYILKSMDFLIKNNFVSKKVVRDFFEERKIMNNFLVYLEWYLENLEVDFLPLGSYVLTKHWHWNFEHEAFKFLSEKSQNNINRYFFMEYRYEKQIKVINTELLEHTYQLDKVWLDFFKRLKKKNFLKQFWKLPYVDRQIPPQVNMMIQLVASQDNRFMNPKQHTLHKLMVYICDALDFIEKNAPGGFMSEVLANHSDREEFENRFNLLRISAKMDAAQRQANGIQSLITFYKKNHSSWSTTRISRATYDQYVDQFVELFNQYKAEYHRVTQKNPTDSLIRLPSGIPLVIGYFEHVKGSLKAQSNHLPDF